MSPASRIIASGDRGLGSLAFAFSIGLHGALVAGFVFLPPPSPPSALPVFTVEVVQATELATAGETEASESLSSSGAAEPLGVLSLEPSTPQAAETVADAGDSLAGAVSPPVARETRPPKPMQEPEPLPEEAPLAETVMLDPPKPARKPVVHEPAAPKVTFDAALAELKRPFSPAAPAESMGDATPIRVSAVAMQPQGSAKAAALTTGDGGNVEGGGGHSTTTAARYSGPGLSNPAPRYPYRARRKGQEGRAILRVEVTASGDASTVWILRSSGHRLLDDAAVDAVRAWRFQPASRAGIPVAGLVDVPISFKLQDH